MQRAFVDPGAPLECIGAKELAPKIGELTAVCRKLKISVVFLKANRHADLSDSGLISEMYPNQPDVGMEPMDGKKGCEF